MAEQYNKAVEELKNPKVRKIFEQEQQEASNIKDLLKEFAKLKETERERK